MDEQVEKIKKMHEFNNHVEALIVFCQDRKIDYQLGAKLFSFMLMRVLTDDREHAEENFKIFTDSFKNTFIRWMDHVNKTNS